MHKNVFRILSRLFIYRLFLNHKAPAHLPFVPHDPWPGNAVEGNRILLGDINIGGNLVAISDLWDPEINSTTYADLHSFAWLRDLRSVGDNSARKVSRQLIQNWIARNKNWRAKAWAPAVVGRRLSIWISLYDFFGSSADDAFRSKFLKSITKQYRHLQNSYCTCEVSIDQLHCLKGLIFTAAALFDDKQKLELYLGKFCAHLVNHLESDGMYKSRRVDHQLSILRDLIDIRSLLKLIGHEVPRDLQQNINLIAPVIRLFRHGDGGLAGLGDGEQVSRQTVDMALSIADVRGRAPIRVNRSGFERCTGRNSLLLVNAGRPMSGADDYSIGLLNFEWSYGRERIIVRSDSLIGDDEPLLSHQALGAANVRSDRQQADGDTLLELSLDYKDDNHLLNFKRKLFLAGKANNLRGQDYLLFDRDTHSAQRFVFCHGTQMELLGNGKGVDIILPSKLRWQLLTAGVEKLEIDDILLPRESKQPLPCLYLMRRHTKNDPATLKWAFHKAG